MSEQFKRENRYTVIKNKTGEQIDGLVIEKDWPEYEPTWKLIEARVTGSMPNTLDLRPTYYTKNIDGEYAESHCIEELQSKLDQAESFIKKALDECTKLLEFTPLSVGRYSVNAKSLAKLIESAKAQGAAEFKASLGEKGKDAMFNTRQQDFVNKQAEIRALIEGEQ